MNIYYINMWYFILPFISVWFVARCLWTPMRYEKIEDEYEREEPPYEEKYPLKDEYDREHKPDINENSFVMESTPDGMVIMSYDDTMKHFKYWTDRNISYKYLNVVARKYCKFYNCWGYYRYNDYCSSEDDTEESSVSEDDELFLKRVSKKKKKQFNTMNRFCYKGSIKDFNIIKRIPKRLPKNINFSDFIRSRRQLVHS